MFAQPKTAGTPARKFISAAALLLSISAALALASLPAHAQTAAGRTAGTFAVSPTGAATYTIPIWAPPGPKGMQPNIALTYNSQQGNGYLGMGWSLSGLSMIYRCNLTTAQDAAPAPVALVNGDGYCMDGQRLRLTSGTYGQGGSAYQTEVANFVNVTAYSTSGVNGIGYWVAQDRNGRTYTYGQPGSSNSQVLAGSTSTAWEWALNEVSDPYQNTMTISYYTTNALNTVVPETISWTPESQGSSTYDYTMTFAYNPTNAIYKYVAGVEVSNANLLGSISIQYNGATVKVYGLSYAPSAVTGRERISEIQECSTWGNSSCLTPTTISYQPGVEGTATTATTTPISTAKTIYAHYDFNHDGYPDLLFNDGTNWKVSFGSASGYGTPVNTGFSASTPIVPGDLLGNGTDGLLVDVGGTWYYYTWNGSAFAVQGSAGPTYDMAASQYMLADVNGDGLPDLVKVNWSSTTGITVYVYLNNGGGNSVSFAAAQTAYSANLFNLAACSIQSVNVAANSDQTTTLGTLKGFDFNGDGRQDLLLTAVVQFFNEGNTCVPTYEYAQWTFPLISTSTSTTAAFTSNQGGYPEIGVTSGFVPYEVPLNWNSDSCTDLFIPSTNTVNISACNGSSGGSITLGSGAVVVGAMDWNGDGLTDLLVAGSGLNPTLVAYLSTGNGVASISTSVPYVSTNTYFTFNANGDGLDDLGYLTSTGTVGYFPHNGAGQPSDLLSTVTDGYGNSASPTYVSLVGSSNYTLGTSGTYPYQNYVGPLYVASQATFSDPSGTAPTYYQDYEYWYAETNLQGRGFAGFGIDQVWDSRNSLAENTYYLQTFPYTGMLYKDLLFNSSNNLRQSIGTYTNTELSNTGDEQRWFPYFSNWTAEEWELGGTEAGDLISTTSTNYTYDNYGNPLTIATIVTDNDPGSGWEGDSWTTTTTNQWTESTSPWCLSLLSTSTVAYSASNGSTPVTINKTYTPNTTECNYTKVVTQPSTSYQVTEALAYDSFGNVNSDTVTGNGMTARVTTANWGTTGQLLAWVQDPSGAKTQFSYNWSYGTISTLTDPNSTASNPIVTTWTPDAFGREAQITRPDGTYTTWTYTNCSGTTGCLVGANGLNVAYSAYGSNAALMTSGATYTDPVGRPLVTLNTMLSGSYARVDTRYDALGRVHQTSFPCTYSSFTAGCSNWTTNTYDALNRLTVSQRPISAANNTNYQYTNYAYAGVHTTITDALSHNKTIMTDVNGWQRQTTDAYGYTITTQYDAAGNPTGVVDNSNNRFLTETYNYGIGAFPASVTDADLGTWTYTYDALGELTAWWDAKNQGAQNAPFTMTYDALSRPYTRSEPDLFTQWTWGSSASSDNIGKLQSVCTGTGTNPTACTASPGYSESETYDTLGRLSQRAITLPGTYGATYTYTWAYNPTTGLLNTLTYPKSSPSTWGPLQLQYGYANGILRSITDTTSSTTTCGTTCTVWTADTTDPMGHVTEETLGNGIVTTRSYDAVTGWLSTAQSVNGSTTVSNLAFLYDYMGNVTQRQDVKQSLTETLCYDNDYRLTQTYAGTGTCTGSSPTLQIQYASNGNITSRSDVAGGATWAYGSTQPHAVTQAGSSSYVYGYDANGNATSRQGSSIAYSSYNYPTALSAGSGSTAESVTLSYGPDRQRWQQNYSGNPTSEITNYVGGLFEVVYYNGGVINYRHYINAGGENVAVYSRENNGTDTYYYLVSDHQGSVASITSSAGSQDFGESYTPFGNRRNPSTWADPPPQYTGTDLTASAAVTRQGYTFQTQLGLWMGMNHMNGRVEDSITGRMISADPFVPDPTNSQSYNRYSYVLNNPVTLSDPSGFIDCTAQVDAVQGDYQNFPCTQNDDPPLTGPTIWGWPLPLEDPANPQPSSMEGGYCGGNNTNCPDSSQQLVNNNYEYGTLHTVTVQANRCTPPPISTLADRTYDPFDPSTHNYQVQSLAGYQMTPAQRQALFNGWRNGLNAAPGIAPNTPDATPVLLANVPFTPDTNWIYLRTNPSNLTWTNVTLPGHYFYPGTVVNSVVTDAAGFTWLVTTGTGATGRWFQNDVLGSAFFKLSQGEAITRFYGGGPMVRMGSAGSCN